MRPPIPYRLPAPGVSEITGFSPGLALRAKFIDAAVDEPDRQRLAAHLQAVIAGETTAELEIRFVRREGDSQSVSFVPLPLKDSTGENSG